MLPTDALMPLLFRAVTTGGMARDVWYAGGGWLGWALGGLPVAWVAGCCVVGAVVGAVVAHLLLPLSTELSTPRGPWDVACTTVCVADPAYESDVNVRVYFPVRAAPPAVRLPLLAHGSATAGGYAYFMHMPTLLLSWLQYLRSRVYDAHPEYTEVPEAGEQRAARGGGQVTVPSRFPVLVFSHGLGGTPDCYSTLIADVVSHGWVVAAPEHAEGSGAYTKLSDGTQLMYVRMTDAERADKRAEYRLRHRQLKARVTEMCATMDLLYRLAGVPVPPVARVTTKLSADGDTPTPTPDAASPPPAGGGAASTPAPAAPATAAAAKPAAAKPAAKPARDPEDMQLLKYFLEGRVDAHSLVVAGHSFGAATALATADHDRRPAAVVALDPWMFPLSATTMQRGMAHVPVLSVCGDGFTVWPENAVALRVLLSLGHRGAAAATPAVATPDDDFIPRNGVDAKGGVHPGLVRVPAVHAANAMITVPGIEHQNFNDFAVVMRRALRLKGFIGSREPRSALSLLASLTRAYATQALAAAAAAAKPAAGTPPTRPPFTFVLPPDVPPADAQTHPWTVEQAAASAEAR